MGGGGGGISVFGFKLNYKLFSLGAFNSRFKGDFKKTDWILNKQKGQLMSCNFNFAKEPCIIDYGSCFALIHDHQETPQMGFTGIINANLKRLFLDRSRLQRTHEVLERANPMTRLAWTASVALQACSW